MKLIFFYHTFLHKNQIVTVAICYTIRKGVSITFT